MKKVLDTNLEIKERKYNSPTIIRLLSKLFPENAYLIVLWDNFNGTYGMMISTFEGGDFTTPDSNEDYYYTIDSNTLYVSLDGDKRVYPKCLKNKSLLSRTITGIITEGSKFYPTRVFDCIILDSRMGRIVGIGSNSSGEELFDIEETAKCSKVLYMSI